MCCMYLCPIYTLLPFEIANTPSGVTEEHVMSDYVRVFMTLDTDFLLNRAYLIYQRNPKPVDVEKTYHHYTCLMTINVFLNMIGTHRHQEKMSPSRIREIHHHIKRLIPLFDACKDYSMQYAHIPDDIEVESMITGSPRASLFPDRMYVPMTFDSISSGSFFPCQNQIFYTTSQVGSMTWELLQHPTRINSLSTPISLIVKELLSVFWEDNKKEIWMDIMHPSNLTGAIYYWSALYSDAFDALANPPPSNDEKEHYHFLQSDVVNNEELSRCHAKTQWLKHQLTCKIMSEFGSNNSSFCDHNWLYAVFLRLAIAQELSRVYLMNSHPDTCEMSLRDAIEQNSPKFTTDFSNVLNVDRWQINRDLACSMQTKSTAMAPYPQENPFLRACAATKTVFPLPSEINDTVFLKKLSFSEHILGMMGYAMTEATWVIAQQPLIKSSLFEQKQCSKEDVFENSARQKVLKFIYGMDATTKASATQGLLGGNESRDDIGKLSLLLNSVSDDIKRLHPAGVPSFESKACQKLHAFYLSHMGLLKYAITKNPVGVPNDAHMIFTDCAIKPELFSVDKERLDMQQKTRFGVIGVIDLLMPSVHRCDLPEEGKLPDLYSTLVFLLQQFNPSQTNCQQLPPTSALPIDKYQNNTLLMTMDYLLNCLGSLHRLNAFVYSGWCSSHSWFTRCVETLMLGGFSSQWTHSREMNLQFTLGMSFVFEDKSVNGLHKIREWLIKHPSICELALLAYFKVGVDRYPQAWKWLCQKYYAPVTFFRLLAVLIEEFTSYLRAISSSKRRGVAEDDCKLNELCQIYATSIYIDTGSFGGSKDNYFKILNAFVRDRLNAIGQFMVSFVNPVDCAKELQTVILSSPAHSRYKFMSLTPHEIEKLNHVAQLCEQSGGIFDFALSVMMMQCNTQQCLALADAQLRYLVGESVKTALVSGDEEYHPLLLAYLQHLIGSRDIRLVHSNTQKSIIPVDYAIEPLEYIIKQHYDSKINWFKKLESKKRQSARVSSDSLYCWPAKREILLPTVNALHKPKFGLRINIQNEFFYAKPIKQSPSSAIPASHVDEIDSMGKRKRTEYESLLEEMNIYDGADDSSDDLEVTPPPIIINNKRKKGIATVVPSISRSSHPNPLVDVISVSDNTTSVIFGRSYNEKRKMAVKKNKTLLPDSDARWDAVKRVRGSSGSQKYRLFYKDAVEQLTFAQSRFYSLKSNQTLIWAARDLKSTEDRLVAPFPLQSSSLDQQALITREMGSNPRSLPMESHFNGSVIGLHKIIKCCHCHIFFEPHWYHPRNGEGHACLDCIYQYADASKLLAHCIVCCDRVLITSTTSVGYSPLVSLSKHQQDVLPNITQPDQYPARPLVVFDPLRASLTTVYFCKRCSDRMHVTEAGVLATGLTKQVIICIGNESICLSTYVQRRKFN